MTKINPRELKNKSLKELSILAKKEKQHLRDLYFRLSGAQLKNVKEIKSTKRNIARILTVLNKNKQNE